MTREMLPRILIFIPNLQAGGAQRVAVSLANGFATRGYPCALVVGAGGSFRSLLHDHVCFHEIGSNRTIGCLPGLFRRLRTFKPDVLFSMMTHANIVAVLAHKLSRTHSKLVLSERVTLRFQSPTFGDSLALKLMPLLYRHADRVAVVARDMENEVASAAALPADRVVTLPNPVLDAAFRAMANDPRAHVHPWLSDKSAGPVILAVGRLYDQKDFSTLIRAFAKVRAAQTNARLIILGEGELREELTRLADELKIGEAVAMPGFAENPYAAMRRADLFVLSSVAEGLPGVLIQAMACGLPVVSTDCPTGPREILEDGRWGRLVPVGDVQALSSAILETIADDLHPDVKARAALYDEDRAIDQHLNLFAALLEENATKETTRAG